MGVKHNSQEESACSWVNRTNLKQHQGNDHSAATARGRGQGGEDDVLFTMSLNSGRAPTIYSQTLGKDFLTTFKIIGKTLDAGWCLTSRRLGRLGSVHQRKEEAKQRRLGTHRDRGAACGHSAQTLGPLEHLGPGKTPEGAHYSG